MDWDEHTTIQDAIQQIKDLTGSTKSPTTYHSIISVPCFEYWLLLHFCCTNKPFQKTVKKTAAQNVKLALKEHVQGFKKTDPLLFSKFEPHIETALSNAKQFTASSSGYTHPSTEVHTLVKRLYKESQ